MHRPHVERSGDRLRHRPVEPPDQRSHDLSNDQSKCISAEHGDDRRRIKSPHDQTFEHETERAHDERGRYHSEPDRQAEAVGKVGDIGAQQNELALREVEDTHHAGDDAEPKDDQNHDRAETQYLENRDDQISHAQPPSSHCQSLNPLPVTRLRFQSASRPLRSDAPGSKSIQESRQDLPGASPPRRRPARILTWRCRSWCPAPPPSAERRSSASLRKLLYDHSRIHGFRRHGISSRSILPTINVRISASAMVATRAANTFGIT